MNKLDVLEEISLGSGFCLGSFSESLVQVWSPNSSTETSDGSALSNDMKAVMDKISTVEQLVHMLVGQSGASAYLADDSNNEPEKKKVSCCPPLGTITTLCSIFVIVAHDVVLFVTRENMLKNHGMMFPPRIWPTVSTVY